MRGFGFRLDLGTGVYRKYVYDHDGIKKWADTGELAPDPRRPDCDDNEGEDET